jgi:hypothetical protein
VEVLIQMQLVVVEAVQQEHLHQIVMVNGGSGSFVVQTGFAGSNGTPGPVSGSRYFAGGGVGGHNPSAVPCATQTPGVGGGGGQTGGGAGGAAGIH